MWTVWWARVSVGWCSLVDTLETQVCSTICVGVCERVANMAAERTGDVVAPVIPFGYSEYFKSYPGTLSVRPETLAAVLEDYVDCLVGQGFRRLVFFSGHAGNAGVLDHLCRRLRA